MGNIEGNNKHVDNHAIAFHPTDPDFVLCGTDGGIYVSYDFAKTWKHISNLPLTQFYKVDVDYDAPFYHVVGGTQDNSTQYGPSRTRDRSGIHNSDWIIPIGGDGHDNAINPDDPNIIYCESQQGFIRRYDRRTGESIGIRPAPGKDEPNLRFNWDSPILISPHDSSRVYIASNFLHQSDDHGDSWKTISPDLSRNENRLAMPMMGRVQGVDAGYDLYAMSQYGNITSVSESPVVEGLIYVGTDDGLIHVTEDGGQNWRKIDRIFGIPEHAFVNDIKADRHDPNTVYACLDDHKTGDYKPYLIRSKDRGKSWESIANDLPDRHLVWRLEQDHLTPELLFLGTEFGVFCSLNAGENWLKLSGGIPNIPVRDLAIQKREQDLVCATFGRGFYVMDDYSPLRTIAKKLSEQPSAVLFEPRKTLWFQPSRVEPVDSLGDGFFRTPNPPTGVVFTVYIGEKYQSAKAKRQAAEQAAAEAGTDVEIPSFETLAAESAEQAPLWAIEIYDQDNQLLNRIDCPQSKGLHRVTWSFDRQLPIANSISTLVGPGNYTAQLVKIENSTVARKGESVSVEIVPTFEPTLEPIAREEAHQFTMEVASLFARWNKLSTKFSEATEKLNSRIEFLKNAPVEVQPFLEQIEMANQQRIALAVTLNGDEEKLSRSVLDVPTAGERLGNALFQAARSTHGPTATSRQQVEIAKPEIDAAELAVKEFEATLSALDKMIQDAGLTLLD